MSEFDECFDRGFGEQQTFLASNIAETKGFTVKTPDVTVKVSPDRADLVETMIINGRQCIVIAVDEHVTVNGIEARTVKR